MVLNSTGTKAKKIGYSFINRKCSFKKFEKMVGAFHAGCISYLYEHNGRGSARKTGVLPVFGPEPRSEFRSRFQNIPKEI